MTVRFAKMHGLGNDYVYIDAHRERVADPARLARAVSDRHRGVGSDGLILVGPSDAGADVRMRIFNADGSEAQMCGNGIRCVVRFAAERGISTANPMRVQTGRGTLAVSWRAVPAFEATVDMGAPVTACARVPARLPGVAPDAEAIGWAIPADFWTGLAIDAAWQRACGLEGTLSLVSMGNPHVVLWCRDVGAVPLEVVGPFVERHAWFPERINVHFVHAETDGSLRTRTWERGSGVTLACGTGASAVGVTAVRLARARSPMRIALLGGALDIAWEGGGASVRMTGPAEFVADGALAPALVGEAG
ncbi:MAG: diaminopimelate epimerase [Phycisphaerales bacterium]